VIVVDTLSFGLTATAKQIEDAVESGMAEACTQLLRDAAYQIPKVPRKTGRLIGSASVHVNGEFIVSSREVLGEYNGTPMVDDYPVRRKKDEVVGSVGFDTPYARRQHELPEYLNPTDPNSGPKFLESKMTANAKQYWQIIAKSIKEANAGGIP
jgi:hypothetical protein